MASTSNFDLTYNQQNVVAGGALSNPAATTGASTGSGVTKILSGGSNVTLSPTSGVGDVTISVTSGGSGTVTEVKGQGTVNGITLTGDVTTSGYLTLGGTLGSIANTQLSNSTINIAGNSTALGGTVTQDQITGLSATTAGIVKHTTSANTLALATAGTDYSAGTSSLATGIVKSTTSTGALSIATNTDVSNTFPTSSAANQVYATPNGTTGVPTLRSLVNADLPTVSIGHGGTGVTTSPIDGQLLIGNSTTGGYNLATIAGAGTVSVTNGHGTITITGSGGGSGSVTQINQGTGIALTPNPITTTGSVALDSAYAGNGIGTVNGIAKGNGTGTITAAGTSDINSAFGSQTKNYVYAAPDGANGNPAFRAMAIGDFPSAGAKTILSNNTTSSAVPSYNSLSSILDADAGNAQGDILYRGSTGWTALTPGTSGQFLQTQGASNNPQWATVSGGSGLTSVGLSMPSEFTVSGSPLTANGTITVTKANEAQNSVYAGPSSGGLGAPSFRAMTTSDLPNAGAYTILSNNTGSSVAPSYNSLSSIIDADIGSAQGDILYRNNTGWTVLTPGTSGQVLQTGGASANPSWATVSGSLPSGGTQGQRLIKDYTNTVAWGNDPMIYAEDYGFFASNSASANNTALQNAINAAMSANGTLLIPPGIFSISAAMNIGSSGSPFQGRVKIAGCGKLVTEIIQTAAVDGFDVYLDSPLLYNTGIEFDGFSLIGGSTSSPSSVGINIKMTEPTVTPPNYPSEEFGDLIIINNIQITGYAVAPHYGWVSALMLFNPWHAVITNSFFGGSLNSIPTTSGLGSGFGVYISNGVNCKIECTTIAWFYKGIAMVTTGGSQIPETQGVQINNIQMLNTVNAIYCIQSIMYLTNFLFDNGNNLNSAWETIHIEQHVGSGYITGGQILQKGGTNQIYIGNNSHGVMISNVDFTNQDTSNTRSIYVTGNSTNVVVTGCIFGTATPIQIDSGSTSVLTSANLPFTGSSNVIDNGTGNYTDWWRGKGASLNVNSSAFAIGSGSTATIQWSGTSFDDGFYSSSNNTRITIPSNRGIKRVRLTLSVYWTSNSNGIRTIAIWDNNGNIYAALVTTGDFSTITTGLIDLASVSNPSYFYATGYQDSGSTLNVQSNSASSFTIQVEQ